MGKIQVGIEQEESKAKEPKLLESRLDESQQLENTSFGVLRPGSQVSILEEERQEEGQDEIQGKTEEQKPEETDDETKTSV